MYNFFNFLRKEKWPLLGILLAIIIFSGAIILKQNAQKNASMIPIPTNSPTPSPAPIGIGGDINMLTDKLGQPIGGVAPKDGIASYKSGNLSVNNSVVYDNGRAVFYKQVILLSEERTGKSIQKELGAPEKKLYGPDSNSGYFLYAYPTKGTAYRANEFTDTVTEVWYFDPINLESFMSKWATDYSLQPVKAGF